MQEYQKILVVEDDKAMGETCVKLFRKQGYDAVAVASGSDALAEIKQEPVYGIVLTDLKMPGMDGVELLEKIREYDSNIDVIIMTGYGTIKSAVEAIKLGAADYIIKPFNKDELLIVVQRIFKMSGLQEEIDRLRAELRNKYGFNNIVGESPGMHQVYKRINLATKNDCTVLIYGESGTGKELVAQAIHYQGTRAHKRFVPVDCPALPRDLVEAELFGYKKGAFTGAVADSMGLFKSADGGTILLDEITEMPQSIQAKLLRSLQERKIRPVGGTEEIPVDIRIIATTNRNIPKALTIGLFRDDLFYRLSVIQITIPPLRKRKDDIILLGNHFLNKFATKTQRIISVLESWW